MLLKHKSPPFKPSLLYKPNRISVCDCQLNSVGPREEKRKAIEEPSVTRRTQRSYVAETISRHCS